MINFVTSMNKKLYFDYGKRALDEFELNSGPGTRLLVMYEGHLPEDLPKYENITFSPLSSFERQGFLDRFSKMKEANGLRINFEQIDSANTRAHLNWDFRFDAIRFSHKIFSIFEAKKLLQNSDYMVWIDADIRVIRHFSERDFKEFLPEEDQIMAYLGRTNFPKPNSYSEGGWYAFNLRHIRTNEFIDFVANVYTSGEIFKLEEWHDCWVVDTARKIYLEKGYRFKNISGLAEGLEHPFVNCGLGKIFDHLKGPTRKKNGRSFEKDYQRKGQIQ